ncbi:hypothetical protein [Ignatzschineria indica]|nr:hypothetical protein [Ignatzschineria indica]
MILKRSRGTAGANYFALFTSACPPFGINDAFCRREVSASTR